MSAPLVGAGRAAVLALRGESAHDVTAISALAAAARAAVGDDEPALVAWEIAGLAADPRARASIARVVLALLVALRRGSTRLPLLDAPARDAWLREVAPDEAERARLAGAIEALARGARSGPLASLVADGGRDGLLVVEGGFLYADRSHRLEASLGAQLAARLAADARVPEPARRAAIDDVIARSPRDARGMPLAPNDEQRRAIDAVLERSLALVAGGPGTGKTTVILAVVRALVRLGVAPGSIALAAPTGRAAHRISSALAANLASVRDPSDEDARLARELAPATTLHRLLGASSAGRFAHHARNPLAARVVIVDEAAMVDLALAERLFAAAAPDATVALFGDADQLPPVDAGAPFRDLVTSLGAHAASRGAVVRLEESLRMRADDPHGSRVLAVARAVAGGTLDVDAIPSRDAATLALAGVERVEALDAALIDRVLGALARGDDEVSRRVFPLRDGALADEDAARVRARLAALDRVRVLCALRADVDRVHRLLRARGRDGDDVPAGSPVIATRNDAARGLWNGDVGVVVRARAARGDEVRLAAFAREDRLVLAPLGAAGIEPAWAVTVHRAQGSEHDAVVVVLPQEDSPLLTRELLYTALTRARRGAVLVGTAARIAGAAARATDRSTGLASRLDAAPGASQAPAR